MEIFKILGAQCLAVESVEQIQEYISGLIKKGQGGYSVAINAEKIMMYSRNAQMREVIDNSLLPTPDGAGAVLGMKWLYGKKCMKLNLPRSVFELANEKKYRLFILGSKEDVNKKAVEKLFERYPQMIITGRNDGFFKNDEEIVELIEKQSPQIVMVALGSPRQEIFSFKMSSKFSKMIFIGCGGSLDTLAGKVRPVPDFFRYNNLEWLFRLLRSPGSLKRIKRQWILPVFMIKLLFTAFTKKLFKR